MFRLTADEGVINRLGFNNEGAAAAGSAAAGARGRAGIVGVNIGANKDTADRAADYVRGHRGVRGCGVLLHRQRLVAEHAGPARPAAEPPRSTTCWRA